MSKIFKILFVSTLPLGFILVGGGMLWLYKFRLAEGGFYERLITNEGDWVGAHILLFMSAILIFPAALCILRLVKDKKGRGLAEIAAIIALFGSFFLGGQYAIDFIMPLIARAGGEALTVHRGLFETPLIDTMFYQLPDLASVSLFLATIALAWSKTINLKHAGILLALWVAIIAGGVMDIPLLARPAFIVLGLAYIPVAKKLYSSLE